MDLSVVIVSWNARDYLLGCLESLVPELNSIDAEIIVVDNASSDGSPDAVRQRFPSVSVIETGDNLGFAKANNVGLRKSTGRFVALVNSDVTVPGGTISKMLDFMEREATVGMCGPWVIGADGKTQFSCRKSPSFGRLLGRAFGLDNAFPAISYFPHDRIQDVEVLTGCFWMVRRKALEDVGLLDERFFIYAEDVDWCKRFRDRNWRVVYFPEAQIVHYGAASSANAPVRFYIEMQRANRKYWRKHHGRMGEVYFLGVLVLHQLVRVFNALVAYPFRRGGKEPASHKLHRSLASINWVLRGAS